MNFRAAAGRPEYRWYNPDYYGLPEILGWLRATHSAAIFFRGVP
jgi:hypothetical protein